MTEKYNDIIINIITLLQKYDMFYCIDIYADNKHYSSEENVRTQTLSTANGKYYVEDNINPTEYLDNAIVDGITITFQGPLYFVYNNQTDPKYKPVINDIQTLFDTAHLTCTHVYNWAITLS